MNDRDLSGVLGWDVFGFRGFILVLFQRAAIYSLVARLRCQQVAPSGPCPLHRDRLASAHRIAVE